MKSEKDLIIELKNKIGDGAERVIALSYDLERKGNNYKCPNNAAHKNGDKNPSMSWDNVRNQFHCFTCGYNLDIYNFYTEKEGKTFSEVMKENNILPDTNQKPVNYKPVNQTNQEHKTSQPAINESVLEDLTERQIKYMESRGINQETINNFEIKNHDNKIAFVYKRNNVVIGVKTRAAGKVDKTKRFGAVKGSTSKNFYNQDNVNPEDFETLIISEGEFDAMIVYQCEYKNVVSVSDGVNSAKRLIQEEINYLNKFKSIIILSDNDEAGKDMDRIFIDKLGGKVKLIDKSIMELKSDINQEYFKFGKEKIDQIINSAAIKIEGFRDVTAMPYTGITNENVKFIPTGIETLDDTINELESRRVTLVTGRPAEGKSTFVEQIQNNAIDKGYRVLRVDGEHDQCHILNDTYRKIIGGNSKTYDLKKFGRKYKIEPKKHVLEALKKWHYKKLFLYTKGDSNLNNTDQLFEKIKYVVEIEGIDLVILDNLMSLLDANSSEKNEKQSEFMKKCHNLAISHNIHIILVAHPNKTAAKGQTDIDYYQVSGTADLANLADNIINVSKEHDEERISQNINGTIHLLKNRGYGELVKINTYYNSKKKMLEELDQDTGAVFCKNILTWEKYLDNNYVEPAFEDCPF
jgi:KaiC/GvpD/RAD55 family RecA-like ATPase/5S rRNA maturation endonuclease (ribonuclease M5)